MHGTPVARDLAIPRLLVPPTPGILCALGQLVSDLRHDLVETHVGAHADFAAERAAGIVAALTARGDALLAADTVPPDRRTVSAFVDMRYVGQSYELPIALPARLDEVDWAGVPARFHDAHRARFGHADASAPVECVSFGVTAVGRIDTPVLPVLEEGGAVPPPEARTGSRPVYFEALSRTDIPGFHDAPVFARAALRAGNVVEGPAVIEEVSATTILYPGDRAVADASGSLIVEMPA
jgi:N-methylhydantoinase A